MRAGKAYFDELQGMRDEELAALGHELEEQKRAAKERAHWSNQPPALATSATYDQWSRAAYWRMEEAAALLIARDPASINPKIARNDTPGSDTLKSYLAVFDLINRAFTARQIDFNHGPGGYLAWAQRNRISVPAELGAAVREHGHQVDDWKGICDRQAALIVELQAKLEAFEDGKDRRSAAKEAAPLGARERDSLLKLIIGMAVDGYGYVPSATRSPISTELSSALERLGLSLDPDTIRKYLNEAKDLLPPETDEGR